MARMVSCLCLSYKGVFAEHFSWDTGVGKGDWQPVWGGFPISSLVSRRDKRLKEG